MRLKESFSVAPRYTRSVNIERDIDDASAPNGYILTPIGKDCLARVHSAVAGVPGPRAWSVTGPYGSGKSAYVLFLVNLLSGMRAPGADESRRILKHAAPELASELLDQRKTDSIGESGFCPILVTGCAARIGPTLLEAVLRDVPKFARKPHRISTLERIRKLNRDLRRSGATNTSLIVESLEQLVAELQKVEGARGALIVVDELGKFLEFAAHHPDENDVFLLQVIAEATARGNKPSMLTLTVLHQAFEQYASGLGPVLRNEWAKVQGRFEDVAFQHPPEQMLQIIANAIIQIPGGSVVRNYRRSAQEVATSMYELGCAPASVTKRQFCELMANCAPLHPVAALALSRLCGKFGQNQRSLFSFLTSRNVHGFLSFLEKELNGSAFFGLADLYDYTIEALGTGLNIGESAVRWAEVTTTLESHRDLPAEQAEAVKSIGLLSAIGTYGELKPSLKVLQTALGQRTRKICEALQKLSILVYRKHSSSYALWQGSDIDLDERIADAALRLSPNASLANRITGRYAAPPLVAKRHSFSTGTLRYFRIRFADIATFGRTLEPDTDADGLVVYCLPTGQAESQQLYALAMGSDARNRVDVIVAVPRNVESLTTAFRDVELLQWVKENTPALDNDRVARKELNTRLQAAKTALEREINQLFSPAAASRTRWFHRGIEQTISSSRRLSQLLSDICDDVYEHTPKIKNELLNRRSLSSAAAKARRNLIELMTARAHDSKLGIAGFPPELSMYRSLFEVHGLHRATDDGWFFAAPYEKSSVFPAWKAIETFLAECELRRRPVVDLFRTLQAPPFGMKMGVIPLLFCAAAIVHDTEIAFYESGAFVPEMSIDGFERLLRSPERFELRSYRIEGIRRTVFSEYAKVFGSAAAASDNLVGIIKPLYRFFNRLQDYTKRTSSLSSKAIAIREALLAARDPDLILFHDLPLACGFEPFEDLKARPGAVHEFFHELRAGFSELQRCYDDLLSQLQQLLYYAFDIDGSGARASIATRAERISEYAVEPRMKAFIMHLCANEIEEVQWIEAIGSLLAGKPPKNWNDADRARYEVAVSELSRNFRHLEALVFELTRTKAEDEVPAEVFRIGITDRHSKELEAVVSVSIKDQDILAEAILDLEDALRRRGLAEMPTLSLAALAAVSKSVLAQMGQNKARVGQLMKKEA
jgi:hypothetical protein